MREIVLERFTRVVGGSVLALFLLAAPCVVGSALALTITRGPYLQLLTTGSVTIVWNTDTPAACAVEIRELPDGGPAVINGGTGTVCAIAVEGLLPGTRYAYVPLADGAAIDSESVFRADAPALPYTFLAVSDSGTGDASQLAVASRMLQSPADFILHAGDMSQSDGAENEYDPQFFMPYKDLVRRLVFWPCLGNHDLHTASGAPWRAAFYTPANNAAGTENYYSFDYGNAHVVVLNSESSLSPGSAQYVFLDGDLGASAATWKFVAFHRTIYSSGSHGSNTTIRDALVPLFDLHGVDIVFMGHDHDYERTEPLRGGGIVEPGQGTVYVTTGGGGGTLRPVGQSWFTAYSESFHHFMRVSVAGGTLFLEMVRDDGAIRDSMSLVKGPEPLCGDNLVNRLGEQCDGSDDLACPGECDADCLCPPVCGDGFAHPVAEECDGTDARACPGLCLEDCRCGEPPLELGPAADTYIEAGTEATWDHGVSDHLDVDTSPRGITYLRFDLSAIPRPVQSATLTLYCTNTSVDGGTMYPVLDSSWVEGSRNGMDSSSVGGPGLKWTEVDTNRDGVIDERDVSPYVPDFTRPVVALGPVASGQKVAVGVTTAFQAGPGVYTLAIRNGSSDGATYSSRDHANAGQRPLLRVELVPGPACSVDADCGDGQGGAALCCSGLCVTPSCDGDGDCDDGKECTTDSCVNPGTCGASCKQVVLGDGSGCSLGACCGGVCTALECTSAADCEDGDVCTTDSCQAGGTCSAACRHTWPACGERDLCCAPGCDGITDPDCPTVCGNGVCEGRGENCLWCPQDCPCKGKGCSKACCGDGVCAGESVRTCLVDCGGR